MGNNKSKQGNEWNNNNSNPNMATAPTTNTTTTNMPTAPVKPKRFEYDYKGQHKDKYKNDEYKITPAVPANTNNRLNDFIPNELLLFGYTRSIEKTLNLISKIQIPLVIIHLIQSYFEIAFNYQYYFIATLTHTYDRYSMPKDVLEQSELSIHELQTKKNIEIRFSHQNDKQFWKAANESSFCSISNVTIPNWIQNKQQYVKYFKQFEHKYDRYQVIAGVGNSKELTDCELDLCGLLAINANSLERDLILNNNNSVTKPINSVDAKWINLPPLRTVNNSKLWFGSLMSKQYNLLYFGGITDFGGIKIANNSKHSKSIYLLNWQKQNNLQWKVLKNELLSVRCNPSGCLIYENVSNIYEDVIGTQKVCIIGGHNYNNSKTLKSVELLSFDDEKTIKLSDMRYSRSNCGVVTTNETNRRIIVGGGDIWQANEATADLTMKSVECYDINKDMWYMLNSLTRYTHRYKPSLWILPSNPNIIYIAGDYQTSSMGIIEYCDIRDHRCTWYRHGYNTQIYAIKDVMRLRLPYGVCPIQVMV